MNDHIQAGIPSQERSSLNAVQVYRKVQVSRLLVVTLCCNPDLLLCLSVSKNEGSLDTVYIVMSLHRRARIVFISNADLSCASSDTFYENSICRILFHLMILFLKLHHTLAAVVQHCRRIQSDCLLTARSYIYDPQRMLAVRQIR